MFQESSRIIINNCKRRYLKIFLLKMDSYEDLKPLPLSALPISTKTLLSYLMDTPKIIPTDGPVRLPRDWRGLALRVNITTELAGYIQQSEDKTGRVLDIWLRDSLMTVGHLIEQLTIIDRFDVIDDICSDLREVIGQANQTNQLNLNRQLWYDNAPPAHTESSGELTRMITYDDQPGYEHQYHAFVLHAKEDQEFVDELVPTLEADEYQICTVDKLRPGHVTQQRSVAKFISERCKRVILMYSPDFLISPSNKFYNKYAQVLSIVGNVKIIPIVYRECELPIDMMNCYRLYYNPKRRADFWKQLKHALE